MRFFKCAQSLFAVFLPIAVRVAATSSLGQLSTPSGYALLGPSDIFSVSNELVTVQFAHFPLNSSSGNSSFARRSKLYSLSYSRRAVSFTSNETVFALPARATDIRATLRAAIKNAGEHSAAELEGYFISSANNLSVIMNSISQTLDENSFNWRDFSSVASILLKSALKHPNVNRTLVGIVKDPEGKPIVDVAIILEYIVVGSDGKPSPLNIPPSSSHPPNNPQSHLPKRDPSSVISSPILKTPYTLNLTPTPSRLRPINLLTLIASAMNMVALNPQPPNAPTSYTALAAEGFTYMFQDLAVKNDGNTGFSFKAEDGKRVGHEEMMAVLKAVSVAVDAYASSAEQAQRQGIPGWGVAAPESAGWEFGGEVVEGAGAVVARWTLGGRAEGGACAGLKAVGVEGGVVFGCLIE